MILDVWLVGWFFNIDKQNKPHWCLSNTFVNPAVLSPLSFDMLGTFLEAKGHILGRSPNLDTSDHTARQEKFDDDDQYTDKENSGWGHMLTLASIYMMASTFQQHAQCTNHAHAKITGETLDVRSDKRKPG